MEVKAIAILYLCFSCAGILAIIYCSMRFLKAQGARPFIWFMVCVFMYSLGYMLELSSLTYDEIYFAIKVEYCGIPFISLFWFIFALEYNDFKLKKRYIVLLFIIPLITAVSLYTNESHHFLYKKFTVDSSGQFPVAAVVKGWWYYIDFAYETLLGLGGVVLFYNMTRKAQGYRKKQAKTIFLASLIPWAGNVINVLGGPPAGIDIVPFYLSITVPISAFAMFRLRMFDIAPIARTKVFETMHNPVIVLDKDFLVADFNQYACKLFPELTADAISRSAQYVLGSHADFIEKVASAGDGPVEIELQVDEAVRHFSVSVTKLYSSRHKYLGVILLLYDITKDKVLLHKLHQMATVDDLTKVYSRRYFMEVCLQELRWMSRKGGYFSFLLIDIDHFKQVNDTYGHNAGDLVLQNVAEGFRSLLRKSDIIGRYGGEEFTVLLPETDLHGAKMFSERVRAEIENRATRCDGTDIRVTVSVGISGACFIQGMADSDVEKILASLLQNADQALYTAKEEGRNRVCLVLSAEMPLAGPLGVPEGN